MRQGCCLISLPALQYPHARRFREASRNIEASKLPTPKTSDANVEGFASLGSQKKIKSGRAATKGVVGVQSVAWDQRFYDPIELPGRRKPLHIWKWLDEICR
jgi:hypothetical protein